MKLSPIHYIVPKAAIDVTFTPHGLSILVLTLGIDWKSMESNIYGGFMIWYANW